MITIYDLYWLLYWVGAAYALGSATAAICRGEIGLLGFFTDNPPKWALVIEVIIAGFCSWLTVGFCRVQNAYRAAGQPMMCCVARPKVKD